MTTPAQVDQDDDDQGIVRDSLSEKAYVRLRAALIAGVYEPGERLSIRRLAAAYDTSPTPVREAVIQLAREGALELRIGHQPRVPVLTIPQYISIREVRAPLERLAAERAAAAMTDDILASLEELHQRFVQSERQKNWKEALAANKEFHFTVYRAAGNDVLLRIIENLWLLIGPFVTHQYPHVVRAHAEAHPHLMLIDALRRRAPAEAGELIVQDLRQGSYLILERLNAEGYEAGTARRRRPQPSA